jgi:tetratricopeptide (TPR) repeat protein
MYRHDLALNHHSLGNLLASQGKSSEAEAEYRAALKDYQRLADEHPNELGYGNSAAVGHYYLGDLLAGQGKPVDAETEYQAALQIWQRLARQPTNSSNFRYDRAWTHNDWAWLLATCPNLKLRDPEQAVAHALKAVELAPDYADAWTTLGVSQYRKGDWDAAIEALRKSTQLANGGNSRHFFFLAMAHWKLNEKEKARTWYDRAVAWMDKNSPQDEELKRFRDEATALLGLAKAAEAQK